MILCSSVLMAIDYETSLTVLCSILKMKNSMRIIIEFCVDDSWHEGNVSMISLSPLITRVDLTVLAVLSPAVFPEDSP